MPKRILIYHYPNAHYGWVKWISFTRFKKPVKTGDRKIHLRAEFMVRKGIVNNRKQRERRNDFTSKLQTAITRHFGEGTVITHINWEDK